MTASETNAAGLTGTSSLTFTYDTSAPTVTAALAHSTGANNVTSNDALTGTADANATVTLSEGSTVLGSTTANASGLWAFTPTGLAQGTQTITASETNAAGLTGSSSLTFTYDTTAPTVTSETISATGISGGAGVLTAGETAVLTLGLSEAVTIVGGVPELMLNNGGVGIYDASHSTTSLLAFDYTVAAGQSTNSLAVTGVNLEGATVTDAAGNSAGFAGADMTFPNLAVNAVAPTQIATDTNSFGTTILTEVGNNYFLDGTGGTGPELQKGGVNVVAGQFAGWQPIGAAETATGYEVAWKLAGTNDYIVWSTNSSGNFVSQTAILAGNSSTLEALEPSFNQDLNGDGVIGIPAPPTPPPTAPTTPTAPASPATVIATDTNSFGTTVLTEVGNNYFLDGTGGTGPELQKGGANVVAGQFPGWQPIGAAETATGYEVAWKLAGTDDYIVWSTNTSGNFISQTAILAGNSSALEALESSFNQDLNGDGAIGIPDASYVSPHDPDRPDNAHNGDRDGHQLIWHNCPDRSWQHLFS